MVGGLSSAIGIIGGGFLSDWAGRFDRRWYGWLPAIGLLIACPVYFLVLSQTSWPATVWVLALPGVFMSSFIAPLSAITQNVLPPRMRATAFALLFLGHQFRRRGPRAPGRRLARRHALGERLCPPSRRFVSRAVRPGPQGSAGLPGCIGDGIARGASDPFAAHHLGGGSLLSGQQIASRRSGEFGRVVSWRRHPGASAIAKRRLAASTGD